MSEENGKVCCNCRHNIRKNDKEEQINCICEVDGSYLGYAQVMTGWCRHWAKDKEVNNGKDQN